MVPDVSRRTVLFGCGAAGLSSLVGCGGGGEPPRSAPIGGAASPTGAPSPTGPPRPAGFLAELRQVPVGGGAIVDATVLLVQPAAGTVKGYDARCPHAGTIVGVPDSSGMITCPGHLAHYRAADGSLVDGPSPRGLVPVAVRVVDGAVLRA